MGRSRDRCPSRNNVSWKTIDNVSQPDSSSNLTQSTDTICFVWYRGSSGLRFAFDAGQSLGTLNVKTHSA
jgi:hypothetical protein